MANIITIKTVRLVQKMISIYCHAAFKTSQRQLWDVTINVRQYLVSYHNISLDILPSPDTVWTPLRACMCACVHFVICDEFMIKVSGCSVTHDLLFTGWTPLFLCRSLRLCECGLIHVGCVWVVGRWDGLSPNSLSHKCPFSTFRKSLHWFRVS